jgi:hypothetical protein
MCWKCDAIAVKCPNVTANATRLDVSLLLPGLRSVEENFRRGFRAPPLAHSQADRWVVRPPVRTVVGKPENTTLKPYRTPRTNCFYIFGLIFEGHRRYVAPSLTCKAVHAVACTTTADRTRPSSLAHSLVCYHVCSRHVVRTVCGLLICAPPAPPPPPTPPPPLLWLQISVCPLFPQCSRSQSHRCCCCHCAPPGDGPPSPPRRAPHDVSAPPLRAASQFCNSRSPSRS